MTIGRPRVLVTGSSGVVGTVVASDLARDHQVRGYDLQPACGLHKHRTFDTTIGSVADVDALASAMRGIRAVVHLAANADPNAGWSELLEANIVGTQNVFEAAAQATVSRVVFASSNHASGIYTSKGMRASAADPPAARNLYGVTKAFGEVLGHHYAHTHHLSVICLRVGWLRADDDPDQLPDDVDHVTSNMWISHRDMCQIVRRSIAADVHFGVFYAMSSRAAAMWDLDDAAARLGYRARD